MPKHTLKNHISAVLVAALIAFCLSAAAQTPLDWSFFTPEAAKAAWVSSAQENANHLNAQAAQFYDAATKNWKAAATQARANKQPLPAKPIAPLKLVITAGACPVGNGYSAGETGCPVLSFGDPVGPPVPDLDPLPAPPPAGNIHIGTCQTYFDVTFCQALSDDTVAAGEVVMQDGHTYKKYTTPWGSHYEQIN